MTDNELKMLMEQKEQLEKAIDILKRELNLKVDVDFYYDESGNPEFVGYQLHYNSKNDEWTYLKTNEGELLKKVL